MQPVFLLQEFTISGHTSKFRSTLLCFRQVRQQPHTWTPVEQQSSPGWVSSGWHASHYCHLVISSALPAPFQSTVNVPHVVCPVWWEVFHSGHRERCMATLAVTHGCSAQFSHCNRGLESAANAVRRGFCTYAGLFMS